MLSNIILLIILITKTQNFVFLIRESMRDNEGVVRNGKLINIGLAIVMFLHVFMYVCIPTDMYKVYKRECLPHITVYLRKS